MSKEYKIINRVFDRGGEMCRTLGELSNDNWYVVAMTESMSKVKGELGQGSWTVLCREKDGTYR